MLGLCLAPIIMLGYASTIQTSWHTSKDISGPYAEIQSCATGLGGRVAFGEEWVQVGPQYGLAIELPKGWSILTQAHGGLGYSNTHHPESGIRQVTKWNGGLSLMLSNGNYVLKGGYDHMSNGRGIDPTNHGQDMWTIAAGYRFE